jgi:hypothetical protein
VLPGEELDQQKGRFAPNTRPSVNRFEEAPMPKVIFDMGLSLDEFMTASNVRLEEPMGDGGQRLHEWASAGGRDREILAWAVNAAGAFIAGRRTYDTSVAWWGADGPSQ